MRRRWGSLFFVVGLVCLAAASRTTLERTGGSGFPPSPALAGAALVLGVGLVAASRGWIALLAGAAPRRELAHGFMLSQLGKYIPGGVWLGVGQVGSAVGAGVPATRAAAALAALGLAFVVAAATLGGAMAALGAARDTGFGAVALVGLAFPVLLHRRWMVALGDGVPRWFGRRAAGAAVPSQRRILAAAAWSLASVCSSALAYALLLHALDPRAAIGTTAAGFSAAWLAGYLVLGLPSGIGAREAVLVALLPTAAGSILAASLAQRLVQMAVEVVLAAATRLLAARSPAGRNPSLSPEVPRA